MDLLDYIKWRGDLSFENSPLNTIDALIFCQLSYLHFDKIVSENFENPRSLNEVANSYASDNFEKRKDLGIFINPKLIELLFSCAESVRFSNVQVTGFKEKNCELQDEQFSAVTFLNKSKSKESNFVFVAFRGTDDTLLGWKEDCDLAFKENLPGQKDALLYLEEASKQFKKMNLYCGGHSKGGNLAIYAGANINQKIQKSIFQVYNFDGPGFLKEVLQTQRFQDILPKTTTVFPQGSIVGMLFEHDSRFIIAKSEGSLVGQHDPFSWEICGPDFDFAENLEKYSLFFNETFNQWFVQLTSSQRKQFVETLFDVLESTEAKTTSELMENWAKNGGKILIAFASLDKEIRNSVLDIAHQFISMARKNIFSGEKAKSKKMKI